MANPILHLTEGSAKPQFAEDGQLILYSNRWCPFAQRVHLVLEAKGLPYHTVYINLKNKPEWLKEVSALGKVPALQLPEATGDPLIESLIIADYLDEKYPQIRLHARDALQKAKDRILIERFSSVTGALYKIYMNTEQNSAALVDLSNGLDIFEAELRQRDTAYFGGEGPGMLDYMIWPWCERAQMLKYLLAEKYELDKERFAKLLKWKELMLTDDAVKATYVSGDVHAKFMRSYREGHPDYDMLSAQAGKRARSD